MNPTFHQTQPQVGGVEPHNNDAASTSQTFGLIVPGSNVQTNFVPTDHTGTKFAMTLNFPCTSNEDSPLSVADLVLGHMG